MIASVLLKASAVRSKENEISAAAALVHPALVKGRIISTDAMHTHKKGCACVHGDGRLEIREIWTSTHMNGCFETEWAGVAQVFRLRRCVKDGDKERKEIVSGVTNLPRKKANASRLLDLQHAHWRVENRLHYRRDVTLEEDACQLRITGAPEALAALKGGVLALMDWLQVPNVASQMRHFCAHPGHALQFLCHKLSR